MILQQDIPTLKDIDQLSNINDDVIYSSRRDEDIPEITEVQLSKPDDLGIKIREPIIKEEVSEIQSKTVDLGNETVRVNEDAKQMTVDTQAVSVTKKKMSIIDKIVLTIYQLIN